MNFKNIESCPISITNFEIEMQLLLTCCRKKSSENDWRIQRNIAKQGFDEIYFVSLVKKHKVAPLVYINLREHESGIFSKKLIDELEDMYRKNSYRALQLHALVSEMIKNNPKVKLSIFKGLDSSLRIFGDIACRDIGDLDLLCKRSDAILIHQYLINEGWLLLYQRQKFVLDSWIVSLNLKDIQFIKMGFPRIELHFRLTQNPIEFGGASITDRLIFSNVHPSLSTLNNEELFVYLCVHGFRHGWERLKWLFDFPEFIESEKINWKQVCTIAKKNGVTLAVQQTLILCEKILNVKTPDEVKSIFTKKISYYHWKLSIDFIIGKKTNNKYLSIREMIDSLFLRFHSSDKLISKIATVVLLFFPSEYEYDLFYLPPPLRFIYVPLRPLNWIYRRILRNFIKK